MNAAVADLFSWAESRPVPPCDPGVAKADRKRLTGQNLAILERLRQGPATNGELAGISLKYTSRISDLRKAGHTITAVRSKEDQGTFTYTLETE